MMSKPALRKVLRIRQGIGENTNFSLTDTKTNTKRLPKQLMTESENIRKQIRVVRLSVSVLALCLQQLPGTSQGKPLMCQVNNNKLTQ